MTVLYTSCRVCREKLESIGPDDRIGGLCNRPTMSLPYRGCHSRFWSWFTQNEKAKPSWKNLREAQNRNIEKALQEHARKVLLSPNAQRDWPHSNAPSLYEIPEYQIAVETWIELGAPDVMGIRSHHLF